MGLFNRRPKPTIGTPIVLSSAAPAPAPAAVSAPATVDWSDDATIRGEWTALEDPPSAMLGWENGMALFEQGPVPMQRMNVAEYMCRGLAYSYVGPALVDDRRAVESVRRVLIMIEQLPADAPPFLRAAAPKYARLALALTRMKGWQPAELGGDGQVSREIQQADRSGLVWNSVSAPGVLVVEYMRNFFQR